MRKLFYVDQSMCGGEELPPEFDLEDFCEVLQGKVSDIEIVPVTDSFEGARGLNADSDLLGDAIVYEALGEYCHR